MDQNDTASFESPWRYKHKLKKLTEYMLYTSKIPFISLHQLLRIKPHFHHFFVTIASQVL